VIDGRLVAAAAVAALAAVALTVYVVGHPINPTDVALERDVQAVDWGPIAFAFPIFSFIGDAKGVVIEAVIFALVLILNSRAWPFAALASFSAGWYLLLSHVIVRPRPTTAQVLYVTEHPGASSFPSGHTMFVVTVVAVLMLCFGYRYLRGWVRVAGWVVAILIAVVNGIGRIDTGAHWPTDVAAGFLIAAAWLALVLSLRPINHGVQPP
jgi:membrane-associated phospholipid phosphatase